MNRRMDGPKDQRTDPTDQVCVLCEKWFTIFQVDYISVKANDVRQFVYICHHDRLELVEKAVESKLVSRNTPCRAGCGLCKDVVPGDAHGCSCHMLKAVSCLRCQPGGDLQATCSCGAVQHHNEVVHPRHERCGSQHAYGACKLS